MAAAAGAAGGGGFSGWLSSGTGQAVTGASAQGMSDAASLGVGALQNKLTRKAQAKEAKRAREWAEMMRATAYQTAVKDLEAAGLNPALAYVQGPSHTPGAAMAHISQSDISESMRGVGSRMISSARQSGLLNEQIKTMSAQREVAQADAEVAKESKRARVEGAWAAADRDAQSANLSIAQARRAEAERTNLEYDSRMKRADAEFYETEFGQRVRNVERTMQALPAIGPLLRTVAPGRDRTVHHQHRRVR